MPACDIPTVRGNAAPLWLQTVIAGINKAEELLQRALFCVAQCLAATHYLSTVNIINISTVV